MDQVSRHAFRHALTAGCAVALLCAGAAAQEPQATPAPETAAAADPLAEFYGNTLVTRDGGIVSLFYYNADHTFTGKVPHYMLELKGTWYVAPNGDVCRNFDPPPPTMTNPDCGPMRVHHVGEKVVDDNGDVQELAAGIH